MSYFTALRYIFLGHYFKKWTPEVVCHKLGIGPWNTWKSDIFRIGRVGVTVGKHSRSCVAVCWWPVYAEIKNFTKNVRVKLFKWWNKPHSFTFWLQRLFLWYHTLISPYARMAIDQIYQPLVSVTTRFYNHYYNHGTLLVFTSTHYWAGALG